MSLIVGGCETDGLEYTGENPEGTTASPTDTPSPTAALWQPPSEPLETHANAARLADVMSGIGDMADRLDARSG